MFKKISIIIVIAVALILLYASTKPDNFRVERSITIKAPATKIFAQINDLKNWSNWSPWEKLDPNMKKTFTIENATKGKGATASWSGNAKVGEGSMVITESSEPNKIVYKLNLKKPVKANNTSEFTLVEKNGETKVTWEVYGPYNYFSKVMSVFFNCDKMIGKDFEDGLKNLKNITEKK
jgi:hypothetical protein